MYPCLSCRPRFGMRESPQKISKFLLFFAGLFAYFLLKKITAPLRSIAKHLSSKDIKSKEPLTWPVLDEIGHLIESYNKLMNELDTKTEQLIKSEKEGAWKKMAKQISDSVDRMRKAGVL